jgi:hypothetical protein
MTIQAIETPYKGILFRSRLEARWAVFFDALGISWEYEREGYRVSHRLTLAEGTFPYLPDFWLPGLGYHVEVKGSLVPDETLRFLEAAASLSCNDGGGCHDSGGNDIIVLGPVPWQDPDIGPYLWAPTCLHMHKGSLYFLPWQPVLDTFTGDLCQGPRNQYHTYAGDSTDVVIDNKYIPGGLDNPRALERLAVRLLEGICDDDLNFSFERALLAARSARFEHGQSGGML